MSAIKSKGASIVEINGLEIETIVRGHGRTAFFLHDENGIGDASALLGKFAQSMRVIAPSHPGFGHSTVTDAMTTVDDLAYHYLDLMVQMDLRDVLLVGVSFGGWIAAEIAIKSTERIAGLVLSDALGIKVGDRETRDIADFIYMTEEEYLSRAYADPARGRREYKSLSDEDAIVVARNREATARYGWSPFMHNPKLRGRLHSIHVPTLMLWGDADRIVMPDYGRAYASAIPDARFELIAGAGHFPHFEKPDEFARRVVAFSEREMGTRR